MYLILRSFGLFRAQTTPQNYRRIPQTRPPSKPRHSRDLPAARIRGNTPHRPVDPSWWTRMPYRRIRLPSESGHPEPFWVRVPNGAVVEWLGERDRLRADGYPDRPPDIDTPTLRVWLPRPAELGLPYF